ncbi:hypothetical protein PHYPSEUDO_001600, partial [Phytophthora pseudosyringae]
MGVLQVVKAFQPALRVSKTSTMNELLLVGNENNTTNKAEKVTGLALQCSVTCTDVIKKVKEKAGSTGGGGNDGKEV